MTRDRDPTIDLLKGCAILWVLLIHSEALRGNLLFQSVVNHAVPVFVVLFGLNSSTWWRRRVFPAALGEWYRTRARRVLVPAYGALVVWWALALFYRPFGVELSWGLAIRHLLGFWSHVGTGWFVTMILQLIVIFPFLSWSARRLTVWPLVLLGLVVTYGCTAMGLHIVARVGLFNYWIFSPRFLAHVTFGMLLAERGGRVGARAGLLAGMIWAACTAVQARVPSYPWDQLVFVTQDLSLTAALLALLPPLARVPLLASPLAWLGVSSWGVYLGQLLTHNAFVYHVGLRELPERIDRWVYTAILLGGGLFFVWLGEGMLRLATRAMPRGRASYPPAPGRIR